MTTIPLPTQVETIAFAGDWHGDVPYARKAIKHAYKSEAKVIVHVGDFGLFPRFNETMPMLSLENELERYGMLLMVVDGNHENHHWINAQPVDADGIRRLSPRIWHLPRGFRWDWNGVSFMALGGAHSVDRAWGIAGIDWFPEERISMGDALRACEGGHVDVMVTHDAPDGATIPGLRHGADSGFPEEAIISSEQHREILGRVVDNVTPRYLWHGHFHIAYTDVRVSPRTRHRTKVYGLDMNKSEFRKNMNIVRVDDLRS